MSTSPSGGLVVIGGGRMGESLVTGLLAHGWPESSVAVVESSPGRRAELAQSGRASVATLDEALDALADAGLGLDAPVGAVIAVKPYDVQAVSQEIARSRVSRAVSIAAGVTLEDLDEWLHPVAAIRAMPNTPALVGAAASAIAAGRGAGPEDVQWANDVLSSVGTVVELPESALDAVTGLSGSGPAYVFLIAEALIDAGVLAGLARPVARDLAVQTLLGSARLLAETGEEPSALRAAVTSPGGTTAAGLRALEAAGVRSAVLDAVVAAATRARELGQKH